MATYRLERRTYGKKLDEYIKRNKIEIEDAKIVKDPGKLRQWIKDNPKKSMAIAALVTAGAITGGRYYLKKKKDKKREEENERSFSDDNNKGSGFGKKLLLGTAATAAAFAGARRGFFGNNLAMKSNTLWANAGKKLGGSLGDNMVLNASQKYGNARASYRMNWAKANKKTNIINNINNNGGKKALADNYGNKFLNKYI